MASLPSLPSLPAIPDVSGAIPDVSGAIPDPCSSGEYLKDKLKSMPLWLSTNFCITRTSKPKQTKHQTQHNSLKLCTRSVDQSFQIILHGIEQTSSNMHELHEILMSNFHSSFSEGGNAQKE